MHKINWRHFYLLLFAIFPSLALMAVNITEDSITVVVRPLLVSILLMLICFIICLILIKNVDKAALCTAFLMLIFFSFGHILQFFEQIKIADVQLGRLRILLLPTLLILFLGIRAILKQRLIPIGLSKNLTIISGLLVLAQISMISVRLIEDWQTQRSFQKMSVGSQSQPAQSQAGSEPPAQEQNHQPDIYYIILDSYTRQDVLQDVYGFDNGPFLSELKEMGFYVAECSNSNYLMTRYSLPSSLNMDYLDNLDNRLKPEQPSDVGLLTTLVQHSKLRTILKENGYQFFSYESVNRGTNIPDSDRVFKLSNTGQSISTGQWINPFEEMFIKTTAAIVLYRLPLGPITKWIEGSTFPYHQRALVQQYQLDSLAAVSKIQGPKFIFTHLLIPHFPYIFKPDGRLQTDPAYYITNLRTADDPIQKRGYTDQIQYLNSRLPGILKALITESKEEPIIIIQGDHGLDMAHRSAILNAYYFPNWMGYEDLYPTISPVNSFRIVLKDALGIEQPLLDDRVFGLSKNGFGRELKSAESQICNPQE